MIRVSDVETHPTAPEGMHRFLFVAHVTIGVGVWGHSSRAYDLDGERPTFKQLHTVRRNIAEINHVSLDSVNIIGIYPLA